MPRFLSVKEQSRPTAIWLFAVALLVLAMVVVGGITRLTESGLSITEWAPVSGALPPMSDAEWARQFDAYRQTTQYAQLNAGMSLAKFQGIFWWEWAHRLLGRLIGVAFAIPFFVLLALREIPGRLVWRGWVLLALGGLQGAVGWWMVASGLAGRVEVAPERLTVHLGLALLIFVGLVWTGLEALSGPNHNKSSSNWTRGVSALLILVFFQCLLGGLVAGTDAGRVFTDWPLMEGSVFPPVDWALGHMAWLHDQGLVQFNHRMGAYAVLAAVIATVVLSHRQKLVDGVPATAIALLAGVLGQAALGISTLMTGLNPWLAGLHQAGGVIVLALTTLLLWRVRRAQPRFFTSSGIGSRVR